MTSFTVIFDDILELISAQANLILPARDFRVSLSEAEMGILTHAFYLEDDERLEQSRTSLLPLGQGLEEEVIKSQRPMVTDDYERECRGRGLLPSDRGIYAWMGVPLNAGAQTIGVISVGSRDSGAGLHPGAARPVAGDCRPGLWGYRQSPLAARSGTPHPPVDHVERDQPGADFHPGCQGRCCTRSCRSATEILNCEAGSLFLVDDETDELVFEVVLGPVAADLLGRRLPPGTGLVGEAVETGRPMIANDAKRRKEWYEQTDIQTGFDTQDLLVVPMRMHDQVIGVIEVINKVNGAPFTQADQELLTAFTSQATIAIENARLYTMTDQALAARVEELLGHAAHRP